MQLFLRDRRIWLLSLTVIGIIGCGSSKNIRQYSAIQPVSNMQIAETVMNEAFGKMGIPKGNGSTVEVVIEGNDSAADLLKTLAPEFLIGHGYGVVENGTSVPVMRFHVDTLYIDVDIKRITDSGRMFTRYSEARLGMVVTELSGMRGVYNGIGFYEDVVPLSLKEIACSEESYVNVLTNRSKSINKIKPFVLSAIITSMAWFFYSYRG